MHIRTTGNRYPSYAYQPLPTESWKESLKSLAKLSPSDMSHEFNALVGKLVQNSNYIPTEAELNRLICECMFRGKVEALRNMLAQLPLQTLHIAKPANERAWQTLREAMPASCSISRVIVSQQRLDEASTYQLFQAMGGMLDLESLHFDWCAFTFRALVNPPSFPPLVQLRELYVKNTDNPDILLLGILKASPNLRKIHLDSNAGIDPDRHRLFATALADSHASTLPELTLRALRNGKCVAQYIDLLKKAKALTHLDLSENKLSSETCEELWKALRDKPALTHLSLAGCCRSMSETSDRKYLAMLITLPSLVSLDLSHNDFPSSMAPVLMAIPGHPGLQHLDLSGSTVIDELISSTALPAILTHNTTLFSLQLPHLDDRDLAHLVDAMKQNYSLRSLSIPGIDQWLQTVSAEEAHRLYPNYLALMELLALNNRVREGALMEGAMQTVLGALAGFGPESVPWTSLAMQLSMWRSRELTITKP